MNLNDLTRTLAQDLDIPQAQAKRFIQTFTATLHSQLQQGQDVRLPNFGSFTLKERQERRIDGPIGNGRVVPAHRVVSFRPSTSLKEAVR